MKLRLTIILITIFSVLDFPDTANAQDDHGFRFARVKYDSYSSRGRGRGRGGFRFRGGGWAPWQHDHPTAELNLNIALERTTKINIIRPPVVVTLEDENLFEHPILYLCEPGSWQVEEEGAQNLREYLKRGGFILFDDFRGYGELINLYEQMNRVFPDKEFVELEPDHPIWNIYYDIDPIEAPTLEQRSGYTKYDDTYYALLDDNGRIMALACHNQDIGDGWEWPDMNFDNVSTVSFQMGINFVIYALTH